MFCFSNNLAVIAAELHGTSIETDLSLFLGSVIGEEPSEEEMQLEEQEVAQGHDEDLLLKSVDHGESEITIQLDEPTPPSPKPEEELLEMDLGSAEGLTLDLDEIPDLDLSQIEEEVGATAEPGDQTEMLLSEASEFPEGREEQLELNLDEIDLSDLAPFDEDKPEAAQADTEPAEAEIAFDLGSISESDETVTLDLGSVSDQTVTLDLGSVSEEPESEIPTLDLEDFMLGTGLDKNEDDNLDAKAGQTNKGQSAGAAAGDDADEFDLMNLDLSEFSLTEEGKEKSAPGELKLTLESEDDRS